MIDISKDVVQECLDKDGKHQSWLIWCPACNNPHQLDDRWVFNGDVLKPTFSAHPGRTGSLLVTWNNPEGEKRICHSYITNGKIKYEKDCTHALVNQEVELKPFEDYRRTI